MTRPAALGLACLAIGVLTTTMTAQQPVRPTILVSRQLASALALSPGDTIRLSRDPSGEAFESFVIADVYEPTPDPMELNETKYKARLHLPDFLRLTVAREDVLALESIDQLNVALARPDDAVEMASSISAKSPGIIAQPIQQASRSGSTFIVLEQFHRAIALVTIVASTVFLLALSIMLVDERRETVGTLRLIGLSSRRVLLQIFIEGCVIAAAGSLFGLVLASVSQLIINAYFQWHYDTALVFVRVTPSVALTSFSIALPLGVLASVAASWALLRRGSLAVARR